MRTLTKPVAVVVIVALAILGGIYLSACAPQSEPPAAVAYNPEKTQGDVRVVLLRVARLTVFTDKWHSDSSKQDFIAAPAFAVTYSVEIPKLGAFSGLTFSGDSMTAIRHGKPISGQVEGLIRGTRESLQDFKDTAWSSDLREPIAPEGRAAIVEEKIFQGFEVGSGNVDLKIKFQWDGKDLVFDFNDVPLN